MRSNGGLSGAKKTVNDSAASGIWSIRDAQRERGASNWPTLPPLTVNYLVIAGGGGGERAGGGGGAGGLRSTVTATGGGGALESALSPALTTNYTVTICSGG